MTNTDTNHLNVYRFDFKEGDLPVSTWNILASDVEEAADIFDAKFPKAVKTLIRNVTRNITIFSLASYSSKGA